MNIGIVCEGRTDFILLEQVVLGVYGPAEIRPLQPLRDALDATKWSVAGWTQVKTWCEKLGAEGIADEMAIGGLDVLVVQVDGDVCGQEGLPATTEGLCQHIRDVWMGSSTPPRGVVICIPAMSTDVWLVAAMLPDADGDELETQPDPVALLARCGLQKNQHRFREHAAKVRVQLSTLEPRLTELRRFAGKLRARRAAR